ncbi:hypothetical protein [Ferrovibrio xuzhouensis]|uniref:Uncharacterized protein n=1 Tax=Ferrovibrio xuzhouensis TaxID=1576914 RepID=A0ABV7VKN0_9PROT
MAEIVIGSEADLWDLLGQWEADPIGQLGPTTIRVSGWNPTILRFPDEPINHSLTRHTARALSEFYDALEKSYALVKHGTTNRNRLTAEDKAALDDIKIVIMKGSTGAEAPDSTVEDFFKSLVGKMTDKQVFIIAALAVLLYFGVTPFTEHVKQTAEVKKVEIESTTRLEMSKEETRRLEIMASAVARAPVAKQLAEEAGEAHIALLKSAGKAEQAEVHGLPLTGEEARKLLSNDKQDGIGKPLDGRFEVVDINNEIDGGFRVRFKKKTDGEKVVVTVRRIEVPTEDIANLLWALDHPGAELDVKANAYYVNNEIDKAFLVRAARVKSGED